MTEANWSGHGVRKHEPHPVPASVAHEGTSSSPSPRDVHRHPRGFADSDFDPVGRCEPT